MKRGRENESGEGDDEPSAKRRPLPPALAITSPDAKAVREAYHTDCEILATGGDEPYRVFPVNRVIVGAWSEPFRVMINGAFAEGVNARILLPYTAPVVEIAVQHMYFIHNRAEAPVVPPEHAFATMQLAHMYDQRDLFDRCTGPFCDSDTFTNKVDIEIPVLRTLLVMGLKAEYVAEYFREKNASIQPFSLDVHDEVLKPFLKLILERPLTQATLLGPSEYTEEVRMAGIYTPCAPADWDGFRSLVLGLQARGADAARELERNLRFMLDITAYSHVTHCGVLTCSQMRKVLRKLRAELASPGDIDQILELEDDLRDEDYGSNTSYEYGLLMRKYYPLPASAAAGAPPGEAPEGGGAAPVAAVPPQA